MASITVYGRLTCEDTQRSRKLLDAHKVSYEWVDIEKDAEGRRKAQEKNVGRLKTPTVVFADGSVLIEPTDKQLAKKLGL